MQNQNWERDLLEKVALAAITEQTRARRWGIFFKGLLFVYLFAIFGVAIYPKLSSEHHDLKGDGHTAIIDLTGQIGEDKDANADSIIEGLRDAIEDKKTKGIILHANSPGGSPVQSAYVYDEIRRIKKEHPAMPIYTVVSDMCASGCYYIASASDKIFVNPASLVGSIGVIMDGFGFVEGMQKLGVERRVMTAGSHKAMLDPFTPRKESETMYMQSLLNQVHQQFIQAVKMGRGVRLKETPDLFSGLVWSGEEAKKLGLVDDFATQKEIAKDVIGAEEEVNFTPQQRLMDKIAGRLGASFGQALGSFLQPVSLR
ncbi:MAG: signal peptide peptidase SppA [Methylococcales bacterium]|nr:signal peptide peptidase SppA [Methylococcales bacterium]